MDSIHWGQYSLGSLMHFLGLFASVQLAVYWVISTFVCWVIFGCYQAIPAPYQKLKPGEVWLLLIPVFNLFWNFWVFPGLSQSFKAYFDSKGDSTVGDCSARVALWLSITGVCSFVPPLAGLSALVYLILLMVYLMRAAELKKKVKAV
jgi:hypothetical protein